MKTSLPHFYIIYTLGTSRLLMGLVFSLLRWSKASFTLVSNGCRYDEKNQLQRICESSVRLHYLALDSKNVLPHGAALNLLQSRNQYQDFGFIDSDIYAVSEFLSDSQDDGAACQFIPVPASFRLPDEIEALKNNPLGCSYFMRYDNEKITRLRNETGVNFDKYRWESMPDYIRTTINEAGFKSVKFDTARAVNAMLLANHEQVVALPDTPLRHLGGVSRIILQRQRGMRPLLETLIELVPVRSIRNRLINVALDMQQAKFLSTPISSASESKKVRKRLVNHYFRDLLSQLTKQAAWQNSQLAKPCLPPLPISDYASINQDLNQITQELISLFQSLEPHQAQVFDSAFNSERL